jgi:hypothetical protein
MVEANTGVQLKWLMMAAETCRGFRAEFGDYLDRWPAVTVVARSTQSW